MNQVFSVSSNLSREQAIEMIAKQVVDCQISYHVWIDISKAESVEEAIMMGESATWDMPDFESDAKEKFKEFQKEKKKLSTLPFHEILEIGEEKGLWKQTEKQKRLIQ